VPEKSHLTGRLINKFAGQETRASPHLTPFFYTFCLPTAENKSIWELIQKIKELDNIFFYAAL